MLSPSAIDQVLCARRLHASPKASMPLPSAIDEAPMSGAAGNDSQESRVDDVTDSDMDSGPEGPCHSRKGISTPRISASSGSGRQTTRLDNITDSDESGDVTTSHAKKIESRAVGTEDTQPTSSGENRGAFQT
eukprot:s10602_g1.t1